MDNGAIKKTTSLSPLTCQEIPAEVILENSGVYILKKDKQGKTHKNLIEKDSKFYLFFTKNKVTTQCLPSTILVYSSSQCNLNCPVCYEYGADSKEPGLKEIEELSDKFRGKIIGLIGREPTCREDLFEIIKTINKRNIPALMTNGIKLVDYEYVIKLKNNGLKIIFFSFNGFNDEIYQRLNGRALLDLKLRALENIKKAGIATVISTTIARGINDDQILQLCQYCLSNSSFVIELRIRGITPMGKHLALEPYCMSDMVDLIARSLGINKEDVMREYLFWEEFYKTLWICIPKVVRNFFNLRICSFSLSLKKNGKFFPLGKNIDIEKIKKSNFKTLLLLYCLIKNFGISYIANTICKAFYLPEIIKNKKILKIKLRCWPNIYNIDLGENKKCCTAYYKDRKLLPFCYYNMISQERVVEKEEYQ